MAQQKESELQAAVDAQQKLALDLNSKAAEYARLENDWKRIEKLCDIIDSRIKELNVTEDAGALNINVLEVARPEDKPTQPQRTRIMAMALVLGMMLGFEHRGREEDALEAWRLTKSDWLASRRHFDRPAPSNIHSM